MNYIQYLDLIFGTLGPVLVDLLAGLLALALTAASLAVRKYFGAKAQAVLREALNQAVATGVTKSAAGPNQINEAVDYVKRSSPETIKALGAGEKVLVDKVKAAIKNLTS
jgi:hypothetical protein